MALDGAMLHEGATHKKSAVFRPSLYDPSPYLNGPRNNYLSQYIDINPRIISRTINRIMKHLDPMLRHTMTPVLRMQEAVPNVYAPKVDKTRAREAFLRRKLPRLRRDLDGSEHTMMCALFTLVDVLHDPERIPEAVRVGIHEKLPQLMFKKTAVVRERCLAIIETMSNIPVGRDALLNTPRLLQNIKILMYDQEEAVRLRAALALRILVFFRLGPYDMDEGELAPYLVYVLRWEEEDCVSCALLSSLQRLLELKSTKEECIKHGAFNVLDDLLHHTDEKLVSEAMMCMARLSSCPAGENYAIKSKGHFANSLELRNRLFSGNAEVVAAAATFLMYITTSTYGKQAAFNNGLHKPLLEIIHDSNCRRGQLAGFQTLCNLADNGSCRSVLLQEDLDFPIEDPGVDYVRQRLVHKLNSSP